MSNDKEVRIVNPQALNKLGVFIISPVKETVDSILYEVSSLEEMESTFESTFEAMNDSKQIETYLTAKNHAASLLDSLAEKTAEKLLKSSQTQWPGMMDKEIKKLSKLKGFDAEYFFHKVTALIH
jgi:GTP1/Obg family GTP-binding protein